MPTATDLVTDLPADFEVFGQAVDTDFVDLLGGTTGQILSKTSATDLDFTWIANDQGDITGVTAGNGITVTSPTGPVPTVAIDTTITVDKTTAQTLTNKTLTTPIISSISNTGTLTLPTSTDTLVGRATTDTLTNKTLTSPALTTPTISTLTTNGDLLYGTGSGALARRGIGSTGNVLTVSGGLPVWSAPAGGGKMLQVLQTTFATQTSSSSTTYADTGLTGSITPSAVGSKVMVVISIPIAKTAGNDQNGIYLNIVRGATQIVEVGHVNLYTGTAIANYGLATFNYIDSPATISSTTYKMQFKNESATAAVQICPGNKTATMILMEVGA
jgi:hypothetical protein